MNQRLLAETLEELAAAVPGHEDLVRALRTFLGAADDAAVVRMSLLRGIAGATRVHRLHEDWQR